MSTGQKMDMVDSYGEIQVNMKDTTKTMKSTALAYMYGQTADSTKGNGKIIKCMEKENSNGQMVENILGHIMTTKRRDMACLSGLMVERILERGLMECSMDQVYFKTEMGGKKKANGSRANACDGLIDNIINQIFQFVDHQNMLTLV